MPSPLRPRPRNPLLTLPKKNNTTTNRHLSRPRLRPPSAPASKPSRVPSTPHPLVPPSQPQPPTPASQTSNPHPRHRISSTTAPGTALGVLFFLLSWFPAYSFVSNHVVCVMSVTGASMSPFLNTEVDGSGSVVNDRVWVEMWGAGQAQAGEEGGKGKGKGEGKGLERGMVVVYRSPTNPSRYAVKRIIALEGDIVTTKAPYRFPRQEVPLGHVWVEGDQVDGSKTMDSNWVGPVSKSLIVGKVGGVVWPWRKAGRIRWEDWQGSGGRVLVGEGTVEEYEFFE